MSTELTPQPESLPVQSQAIEALLEAMEAHAVLLDPEGTVMLCNTHARKHGYKQLGINLQEQGIGSRLIDILGRSEVLDQNRAAALFEAIPAVCSGEQEHFREELPFCGPGGTNWFLVSVKALGGQHRGALALFYAIGRRKRIEQELMNKESVLREMAENVSDFFYNYDAIKGEMLYLSPSYETLWGRSCESLYEDPRAYLEAVVPEDRETVEAGFDRQLAGEVTDLEYRVARPDGDVRWLRSRAYPVFQQDGSVRRVVGVVRDITERKRAYEALRLSEARFKLLSKATNDAIWDWDVPGNYLWWSEGFSTTFGYLPEEVKTIEAWGEYIHPEDRRRVESSFHDLVEGKGDRWAEEYRFRKKDGSYAYVRDQGRVVRDSKGAAIRVVGGLSDQSEEKQREQQLLRRQRLESLGTLAGGIAHDLNNALAPILMAVDLLKTGEQDAAQVRLLETIQRGALRGSEMVQQVLSFAKGVEGRYQLTNLRVLVLEVSRLVEETFPKNIRWEMEAESDLWLVEADSTQLHQVLMNLCINARDAMPNGGTLRVTLENTVLDEVYTGMNPQAKAGPSVLIRVVDTGTGISQELQGRIFEPFFTTKALGKGTGLGLSTSHAIIKSHGGFINVYSEPGRGTEFKLYLPAEASRKEAETVALERAPFPKGQGECVLVVDDEVAIRTVAQKTLERYGYRVLVAEHGAEAIALYAQNRDQVDLVLTDMAMPVMDGPATVTALRSINPGLPIIGSSGLDSNGGLSKAMGTGINHFVSKPYTAGRLLQVLEEILRPGESNPG